MIPCRLRPSHVRQRLAEARESDRPTPRESPPVDYDRLRRELDHRRVVSSRYASTTLSQFRFRARHRSAAGPVLDLRPARRKTRTRSTESTASRPGAATGQSHRRAGRGITRRARRARADEPSRLSFLRSSRGPHTALGRDRRIASALVEGRAPLNRRRHLGVVRPSAFILRSPSLSENRACLATGSPARRSASRRHVPRRSCGAGAATLGDRGA